MTAPIYNASYGNGFEGIVNYANSVVDWWMVPFFMIFVFLALVLTFSKDRQFPMSAILAFGFFVALIVGGIFKLATVVSEYMIYLALVGLALAVAWGIWQSR